MDTDTAKQDASRKASVRQPSPGRVGRPRATARGGGEDVAEEIVRAAARLVARHGFGGTSTRAIAEEAGLRQPSIFHYFSSKQVLFREMLDRAIQPVLDFVAIESEVPQPPGHALARLVWFDTRYLITNPVCGVAFAASLDEVRRHHPEVLAKRQQLIDHYSAVLDAGVETREFQVEDADTTTRAVFGLGESAVWWASGAAPDLADAIAERHAVLALRMVLCRPAGAERVLVAALSSREWGGWQIADK